MKKLFALLLALVMVLGLATPAFAASTELTITDKTDYASNRSYKAYKILTASVSGLNFSYEINPYYKDVLIEALGLAATATEIEIINAISTKNDVQMRDFAENLYALIQEKGLNHDVQWNTETVTLDQAYWLIVDVTDLDGTNYSNSLVMIDTIGDVAVEIANKPNTTTTTKKIDDENDSILDSSAISEDAVVLQDVADYDIGDAVPYTIDIDMASNIARYDYYSFIIQDSVEEGLTYMPETFKITVRGVEKVIKPAGTAGADFWYEIETVKDSNDVQTSQNLYVYPAYGYTTHKLNGETPELDDYIVVATANKNDGGDFLKLFPAGTEAVNINSSEVIFTYSCLLNENAKVGIEGNPNYYTLKYSNNPYDDGFGESVQDTNLVLTYKFLFDKVDTDKNPLPGADFKMEKFIAKYDATYTGAIPDDYVQHPYLKQWGYYVEITRKTTNAVADDPDTPENEAKEATQFVFNGLDDGLYRITEIKTPAGFNGIDPIEFRIIANHVVALPSSSAVLGSLQVNTQYTGQMDVKYDTIAGSMSTTIENHSGSELPTTGGIGTTIFYILGSVLVIGAAVLLVTKKRMSVEG